MGQKVNPIGLRLGINRNWESRWFPAKGRTPEFIAEDHFARVIQHEYDHLQGVLYPMRVRDWQALAAASERRQLERMLEEGYDRR